MARGSGRRAHGWRCPRFGSVWAAEADPLILGHDAELYLRQIVAVGLLTGSVSKLLELARQSYADARACSDAVTKRRLVAMGDDYIRQAKQLQQRDTSQQPRKTEQPDN